MNGSESVPEYGCYEITFTDHGDDRVYVRETLTLVTEGEAKRCAASWQAMTWTHGRKYSYRAVDVQAELQT